MFVLGGKFGVHIRNTVQVGVSESNITCDKYMSKLILAHNVKKNTFKNILVGYIELLLEYNTIKTL